MELRTLITQDRLDGLLRCAKMVPKGVWAECGVYKGGSLKWLAHHFPEQKIIGYDTFEGLPKEQWNEREIHKAGEFNDTSFEGVSEYLNNYKNVTVIKGLFPQTAVTTNYSFVHVDFDFYEGIKACLDFFYPKLVDGGIMVFDDYGWPNCPGVAEALKDSKVIPTADYQVALIK